MNTHRVDGKTIIEQVNARLLQSEAAERSITKRFPRAPQALHEGLQSRWQTGVPGLWTHGVPTNPKLVGTISGHFSGHVSGRISGHVSGRASGHISGRICESIAGCSRWRDGG